MIKLCEFCGKEFEGGNGQKFCSRGCSNRDRAKNSKECRICKYCLISFDAYKNTTNKFCSHKCYGLNKRECEHRRCNHCDKLYRPTSRKDNQKFCSRKCFLDYKKENSKYIRKCEQCHGEYEVFGTRWKGYGGRKARKFCSKECADLNRIGKYTDENSAQWKGGVTSLQDVVRKCANYTRLRKACFERDNYHSILSGETGILNHHHLTAYSILFNKYKITKDNWRELNHILFDIKNVVTLTVKEHKKFHSIYGKVTTEEQFEEFRNNYLGGI